MVFLEASIPQEGGGGRWSEKIADRKASEVRSGEGGGGGDRRNARRGTSLQWGRRRGRGRRWWGQQWGFETIRNNWGEWAEGDQRWSVDRCRLTEKDHPAAVGEMRAGRARQAVGRYRRMGDGLQTARGRRFQRGRRARDWEDWKVGRMQGLAVGEKSWRGGIGQGRAERERRGRGWRRQG